MPHVEIVTVRAVPEAPKLAEAPLFVVFAVGLRTLLGAPGRPISSLCKARGKVVTAPEPWPVAAVEEAERYTTESIRRCCSRGLLPRS